MKEVEMISTAHRWMQSLVEKIAQGKLQNLTPEDSCFHTNPHAASISLENRILKALNCESESEEPVYEMCIVSGYYLGASGLNDTFTPIDILSTEILNEHLNTDSVTRHLGLLIIEKSKDSPLLQKVQNGTFEHSHTKIDLEEYAYGSFFYPYDQLPNMELTLLYPTASINCLKPHASPDYYHIVYLKLKTSKMGNEINTTAFSQGLLRPNFDKPKMEKIKISNDIVNTIRKEKDTSKASKIEKPMIIDPTPYCISVTHSRENSEIMEIPIVVDKKNEDLMGIPF